MKKITALALIVLVGCSPSKTVEDVNKEDPPTESVLDYSIVETSISWVDVFEQIEERYLVYFYSEYCGYCRNIKEEFLSYYLLNKEKIYFVDAIKEKAVYHSGAEGIIGIDNIDDYYIPGTPFLVEFTNWQVTNYYMGMEAIRMYVSQKNND